MSKIDLSKYGITGTTEVVYNPSYEQLFEEETKPTLEGYEKGQESELGAVNVMTMSVTVVTVKILLSLLSTERISNTSQTLENAWFTMMTAGVTVTEIG